jgi:shikimate kinase
MNANTKPDTVQQNSPGREPDRKALARLLDGRSLVFVGMMGSGKTAIGKMVASALKVPYFDSDAEIVKAANMEIPEIFEKHGEPYFRSGEERVIERLLRDGPAVISLGGGAFMSGNTRSNIAEHAISIWLKGDIELLMGRVLKRPGTRPLLQTKDPRATLAELMKKREPVYALADIHVESSRESKSRTRDAVLRALEQTLQERRSD